VVATLARGERFAAAHDQIVTPNFVLALVDAAHDLLIDGTDGIWHLVGDEAVSWAQFARRITQACGHNAEMIDAVGGTALGWPAPPRFMRHWPANAARD
jgi:dTDP-4-dehydrorhamnose reductase